MGELQELTDRIGATLARSVAIDDAKMRLLTHSPHHGAVDEQRLQSILQRQASTEAVEWARAHGALRATEPVWLPPNDEFGMHGRLCIPIRYLDQPLGYLWIIDVDGSLTDDEVSQACAAAAEAAQLMFRDMALGDLMRAREREVARDVIDPDPSAHQHAITQMAEEGLLDPSLPVIALVLDTTDGAGRSSTQDAVELAIADVRRRLPARRSLCLTRPDHAVVLVAPGRGVTISDVANRMLSVWARERPDGAQRVGVGLEMDSAAGAHESYRQAYQAIRIARILGLTGLVEWSALGVYRLLAELGPAMLDAVPLHPALARLLEDDPSGTLLQTLDTYLDRAGDVRAAASVLFVHRGTLYNRLARIATVCQVDLRKGSDLLDLHLGIKLGQLSGRLPLRWQ